MTTLTGNPLRPIVVDASSTWTTTLPFCFRIALLWARHAPRGKGWVPRQIGRHLVGHKQVAIRTAGQALLAVDPTSLDVYTKILAKGGTWDPEVLEACRRVTRRGDVVYDIGANAGWLSVELAAAFDGDLHVCAFEPQPSLARSIALSAQLNGFDNIAVYQTMLGDREGQADLFIPSHSIHASAVARERRSRRLRCPIITIDGEIGAGRLPPPDVIKIDVEGAELSVFEGARETFAVHQPAIIFENDDNMKRFGYTRNDLIALLQQTYDCSFFEIMPDGELIESRSDGPPRADNMLALPPNRPIRSLESPSR